MVTTRLHTVEELWAFVARGEDFELIEGELSQVTPPSFEHGEIQLALGSLIHRFVVDGQLGKAVTESGYILARDPDTVLSPDISFVRAARLPAETRPFPETAPDLAVEIVSSGNTRAEIDRKTRIYLESGVQAVWIVYPERREVAVHEPGKPALMVTGEMQLDGGDVLPGFAVSLPEIFGT
ncbi:MAG: Uma2 family endonuclease [Thermomicrobiales bacterium]